MSIANLAITYWQWNNSYHQLPVETALHSRPIVVSRLQTMTRLWCKLVGICWSPSNHHEGMAKPSRNFQTPKAFCINETPPSTFFLLQGRKYTFNVLGVGLAWSRLRSFLSELRVRVGTALTSTMEREGYCSHWLCWLITRRVLNFITFRTRSSF